MPTGQPTAPIAVLFQATAPPVIDGVQKPSKPGGYSDSGADIAFNLANGGISVLTPADQPDPEKAFDWVFPDTAEGIAEALKRGARVLWANTVLFTGHPLDRPLPAGSRLVGQSPEATQRFDDKWVTNQLLRRHGCPVPASILVGKSPAPKTAAIEELTELGLAEQGLSFPLVVKPVRGRGSQGVRVVETLAELRQYLRDLLSPDAHDGFSTPKYGSRMIVEKFLPGTELTVAVMPPGVYSHAGAAWTEPKHWCLPPVTRFNHEQGIAPYSGVVAVTSNSNVLLESEAASPAVRELMVHCARAAELVGARAPIRIDARASASGQMVLFDLNMKPNMTGPGRPGRDDQDSLVSLAARGRGWSYQELLIQILNQAWEMGPSRAQ